MFYSRRPPGRLLFFYSEFIFFHEYGVIPAKAGIQVASAFLDPRFREDDILKVNSLYVVFDVQQRDS